MFDMHTIHNHFSIFGMKITAAKEFPRYTLPAEVIPGVPWPPGFRDEINDWSRDFLGMTCIVPRGVMYVCNDKSAVMHPKDFAMIKKLKV